MKRMKSFEDTPIPIWTTMGDAPWLDGKRFPSPRVQEWDVLVRAVKTLKNWIELKMNTHAHTIEQILEIQCISDSIHAHFIVCTVFWSISVVPPLWCKRGFWHPPCLKSQSGQTNKMNSASHFEITFPKWRTRLHGWKLLTQCLQPRRKLAA